MSRDATHGIRLEAGATQFKCVWCRIYSVKLAEPLESAHTLKPVTERSEAKLWCRCGKMFRLDPT
jgi:hypothetical protein